MPLQVPPFSLPSQTFWSRATDTPADLVLRLECALDRLKCAERRASTDKGLQNVIQGVRHEALVAYLAEACFGEALGTQTYEEAREVVDSVTSVRELGHQELEARNITEAARLVLDEDEVPFSVDSLITLHRAVGREIMSDAGQFRTSMARPYGVALMHMHPEVISTALQELVDATRAWEVRKVEEACKRAAFFMARFLLIHPFSDGNGRVARICVSWLMKGFAFVPISLHTGPDSREVLLRCLFSAQNDTYGKASELALYILWSACVTAVNACFAMNV